MGNNICTLTFTGDIGFDRYMDSGAISVLNKIGGKIWIYRNTWKNSNILLI